jgi:tetratricopeptide (TPR) repeat protein
MLLAELLARFQQRLPDHAGVISQCLMQDAVIWKSVIENDFFSRVMSIAGDRPEIWAPGYLALIKIGHEDALRDRYITASSFDPSFIQLAQDFFEQYRSSRNIVNTIEEAALLATTILITPASFNEINKDAAAGQENISPDFLFDKWKTPLAILFTWVGDWEDFVKKYFSGILDTARLQLLTHALICNVLAENQLSTIIHAIVKKISLQDQVFLLSLLEQNGRSGVAQSVAMLLLSEKRSRNEDSSIDPSESSKIQLVLQQEYTARLHHLAGRDAETTSLLKAVDKSINKWQFELDMKRLHAAGQPGEVEDILARIRSQLNSGPVSEQLFTETGFAAHKFDLVDGSILPLEYESGNPVFLFAKARMLFDRGENQRAQEAARQAVENFNNFLGSQQSTSLPDMDFIVEKWIKTLGELELTQEAAQLAADLLERNPANAHYALMASKLEEKLGNYTDALNLAQMHIVLDEDDWTSYPRAAVLWERFDNWDTGYSLWREYIENSPDISVDDWFAYAKCAKKVGRYREIQDACTQVLEVEPDNIQANVLMGDAFLSLKEFDDAQTVLSRATIISPENEQAWLLLSEVHEAKGDDEQALSTLHTALKAIPDSAEINFALAKKYGNAGDQIQSLAFLKNALLKEINSVDLVSRLGNLLCEQEMREEEFSLYKAAVSKWPENVTAASLYARAALDRGLKQEAVHSFEVVINEGKPSFDDYYSYSEAILGSESVILSKDISVSAEDLEKVFRALIKALEMQPHNIRAKMLLAEVLSARKEYSQAMDVYQAAIEDSTSLNQEVYWRIQGGFGYTALALGKVEAALAALREATQEKPGDSYLQRLMAEASLQADLANDAFQISRFVLESDPQDIETLSWFASIAIRVGEQQEAIRALQSALNINGENYDLRIKLGELQYQVGDIEGVRQTADKLLNVLELNLEQLRNVAHLYMKFEDWTSAQFCLERMISENIAVPFEVYVELSLLKGKMGQVEEAFDLSQKALESALDDFILYVYQADLLVSLEKPQAAISCLEHALSLFVKPGSKLSPYAHEYLCENKLLPPRWLEFLETPAGIHIRFAFLKRQIGNPSVALKHAKEAYRILPREASVLFMTADLSVATDNMKDFTTYFADFEKYYEKSGADIGDRLLAGLLAGLYVEWQLESGNHDEASRFLERYFATPEKPSRIWAANARLYSLKGDLSQAENDYRQSIAVLPVEYENRQAFWDHFIATYDLIGNFVRGRELWLGQAACSVHKWDAAFRNFELVSTQNDQELNPVITHCKAILRSMEWAHIDDYLGVTVHSPGKKVLSLEFESLFGDLLEKMRRIEPGFDPKRLSIWNKALLNPSEESIRQFGKELRLPTEIDSLLRLLWIARDEKKAIELYQHFSTRVKDNLLLSLCHVKTNIEAALQFAKLAVEERHNDPISYAALGYVANQSGQYGLALDAYESALSIWEDEPAWHASAASLGTRLGFEEETLQHWQRASELAPKIIHYQVMLAETYLKRGQPLKSVRILEETSRLDDQNLELWLVLSKSYLAANKIDQAFDCADRARKISQDALSPILLLGELSASLNQYEVAIDYARKGLAIDPTNQDAVLFLVKVLMESGNQKEAHEILKNYVESGYQSYPVLYQYARIKKILYGPSAALELGVKMAEIEPENNEGAAFLAEMQMELGDYAGAEQSVNRALRKKYSCAELKHLMGKIKEKSGQLDLAIHYLTDAIHDRPDWTDVYLELGEIYKSRREYPQALKVYQQAIEAIPDDHRSYYQAGLLFRESKDYRSAEMMLRKAAEFSPQDINIRRQLGAVVALNLVHNAQEEKTQL